MNEEKKMSAKGLVSEVKVFYSPKNPLKEFINDNHVFVLHCVFC